MCELKWNYGEKIECDLVKKTESLFNIKLPKTYKEIVNNNDGAIAVFEYGLSSVVDGLIKISDNNNSTISLRRFKKRDGYSTSEIINTFNYSREILPEKFIPFAKDSGGNDYIFDFSQSVEPRICYLHHEESISIDEVDEEDLEIMPLEEYQKEPLIYLADSFEEFLGKIYPGEN